MYCWYCGAKLPGAAAFCHRCGQSQAPDAEFDPNARPSAPDGWSWQRNPPPPPEPTVEPTEDDQALPPPVLVDIAPAKTGPSSGKTGPTPDERSSSQPRRTTLTATPSRIAGVLALLCGVAVVAGSLGPWVTAHVLLREPIRYHGSDGDGRVTLWCGLAALICVAAQIVSPRRGAMGILAAGAFFLAALIGISDWSNIVDHFEGLRRIGESALLRAEIGWGLRAVTFGGVAGTILAMIQAIQARRIGVPTS